MPEITEITIENMHIPLGHMKRHVKSPGIPCGCWDGSRKGAVVVCGRCGAGYMANDVSEFSPFRCYDCNAAVRL